MHRPSGAAPVVERDREPGRPEKPGLDRFSNLMQHLDDAQFRATFSLKMHDVEPDSSAMADVLPCIREIPTDQLQGFTLGELSVYGVYRGDSGLFEHYLIPTTTANVFIVLVRDCAKRLFTGYHLLNLNAKYGLSTPPPAGPAPRVDN
jgi:hypothetical protein